MATTFRQCLGEIALPWAGDIYTGPFSLIHQTLSRADAAAAGLCTLGSLSTLSALCSLCSLGALIALVAVSLGALVRAVEMGTGIKV